jgi:hypothetical protein
VSGNVAWLIAQRPSGGRQAFGQPGANQQWQDAMAVLIDWFEHR